MLDSLAQALESGRIILPVKKFHLIPYVPDHLCQNLINELNNLHDQGVPTTYIIYTLQLLATAQKNNTTTRERLDLVWTGPESVGTASRDTSIVVQELFQQVTSHILIASYVIDSSKKAHNLFHSLAEKMDNHPALTVRIFINIQPENQHQHQHPSKKTPTEIVRNFAQTFRHNIWPGKRLPELFYDPRSLDTTTNTRACMHAKCIVVDSQQVFITSANFTEAAHQRNIEAGVVVNDRAIALALEKQFQSLVAHHILQPIINL
jgi:phosphatidylserine/phosphatidylglycerophosphate/cardiolipin synthase-like enzyme